MKKFRHLCFLPSFAILAFLSSGCSLFTPVGSALTDVYENTVSYFNSYYNAKRAFDEAEAEIHVATQTIRAKNLLQQNREFVVPVASKQKLSVVIDKCSSILSFHPSSSLVDDALLLIGKSYFYQGEYVKSERKFLELNEQYPSSSLTFESRLWLARTYDHLHRTADAIALLTSFSADAEAEGEDEIAAEAHLLLATLHELRSDPEEATRRYTRVTELGSDDEVKTEAQFRVANLYFVAEQFQKAAEEYRKVSRYTSDFNIDFQAKLQTAVCAGRLREYGDAFAITDELLQDFRFTDYAGAVRLERAKILNASGRRDESLEEYRFLDTAYARTETGSLASFELGNIYEKEFLDYATANPFYARAAENKNTNIYEAAQRKAAALNGYLAAKKKIAYNDSLLSAYKNGLTVRKPDSLSSPVMVDEDSVKSVNAILFYDIAEIFYAELMKPDSAVEWYNRSLALKTDSVRGPRILFVQAEIANSYSERNFGKSSEYYRKLVNEYPDSKYADQARTILGLPKKEKVVDPAETLYAQAEDLIESTQYQKAVDALSGIVEKFPTSPYAAKSEYSIGWIYEHRLTRPDSALSHYRNVVNRYASTTYAGIAKPRIPDSSAARKDSVATPQQKPSQEEQAKESKEGESQPKKADTPARTRKRVD